ncbi:hypothetical protein F4804DRAFT_311865 [Jackrogersella minutella]|nr:hypothetical protein F4804DRAFT_311865 [Jackrogersella minutella]
MDPTMDMYFGLVVPEAALFSGWEFSLRLILFDIRCQGLVRLLAVPVKLQSPSAAPKATSSTLTQYEDSLQNSQRVADNSSQEEALTNKQAKRKADDAAYTNSPRHHKLARTKESGSYDKTDVGRPITISDLPPELHHNIFSHIDSAVDVACFGLASRYFWEIGHEYLHKHYMSFFGRWAGRNIICASFGVKKSDLSPKLLSTKCRENLNLKPDEVLSCYGFNFIRFMDDDDNDDDNNDEEPESEEDFHQVSISRTIYNYPKYISLSRHAGNIQSTSKYISKACEKRCKYKDGKDSAFELTRPEMLAHETTYFPRDQRWILRNLTTNEFLRSETIALRPEYIHGPDIEILGFGEVVVLRTCWSESPATGEGHVPGSLRGKWAGHKLDITTVARHKAETKEDEWTDVGREIVRDFESIWGKQYGPDWREKICNSWEKLQSQGVDRTWPKPTDDEQDE